MNEALVSWCARWGLRVDRLRPPSPGVAEVERPRLIAELDALTTRGIVLVTAPAGAGKTVAVAQWLATAPAVAWLRLDAADADPATLVRDVLGALACAGARPTPVRLPRPHEGVDARQWWIEEVVLPLSGRDAEAVLVLDDVHVLPDGPAGQALAELLHDRPPGLRVVLVGRELPPLPLARLEAAGEVGRLAAEALWLTAEESEALLLARLGPGSDPGQRVELHQRSEGWPAALSLLALGATGRPASSQRAIDFVAEEVIEALPDELREGLLDTAVLDRLTEELVAVCTGPRETPTLPWSLVEAGLATPDGPDGVRLQPLLRAALLQRLDPDRRRRAHAAVARHLAEQERLDEAIEHALRADDEPRVELAVAHGFALLRERRMGQLHRLLLAIEPARRSASPTLATLWAWSALRGTPAEAGEALAQARARVDAADDPGLRGSLQALGAIVALRSGEVPDDPSTALDDELGLPTGVMVALCVTTGLAAERAGELSLALARYERAARLARVATPPLSSGITATAHRVRALRQAGRADEARRVLDDGRAGIVRHGFEALPVAAELALEEAMLELEAGRLGEAEELAVAGLRTLRLGEDPAAIARGLLALAMIRRARADAEGSIDAATEAEVVARASGIVPLVAAAQQLLGPGRSAVVGPPAVAATEAEALSARELDVLRLVAQGLANQVIARRLFISAATVKTHMHHILTKLGARNRTEAVHRARAMALLG